MKQCKQSVLMKTDLLNKWINRGFRTNILFWMHSVCVDSYLLDTLGGNPAQAYSVTTLKLSKADHDGQRHNSNISNHYTTELGASTRPKA